jgi:glycosyltransferase involved in cell wall biosynthesis
MMSTTRPLRLCIFASIMRRHRGYFTPHSGLVARILADLGHEVTVLTAELPDGGGAVETEDGVEVHYLAGVPPKKKNDTYWKASAAAFDRLHAERPFDIVFGRGVATWGFFRHSRHADQVPVILHEGTYPQWLHQVETRSGRLAPLLAYGLAPFFALKNREVRICLRSAARVVCNNPHLAAAFRRTTWWAPPRVTSIVYAMRSQPAASNAQQADQPPRLVSVGRLAWDKGVIPMINVLARLSDRTATLEAMGPASAKMRKAVLDHAMRQGVGQRYSVAGPVQHEDVPQRLAGAAAFLFPSTHAEGLPKVVLEAMASGVPVVAYHLPVLDGIIEDGVNGYLVPIRSVPEMADRVDRLLADPALAARMGAAARRKIEADFAPDVINDRWRALLAEVVAEAAVRRGA